MVEAQVAGRVPDADRRVALHLFLAAASLFLLLSNGVAKSSDETSMRLLSASLLDDRSISVPDLPLIGVLGDDGRTVSKYGIGQPLATVPFVILGRLVAAPLEIGEAVEEAVTVTITPLVTAGLVSSLYLVMRRVGGGPHASASLAIGALVGGFGVIYGTEYFAEPFVAFLMLVSIERALAGRWTLACLALSFATVIHPRAAPLIAVLLLVAWVESGLGAAVRAAWPGLLAALTLAGYSWARFGELGTGYEGEGFTTPLAEGTWNLLTHPAKSLFVYAPLSLGLLALPRLWRGDRRAALLISGFAGTTFLLAATWHSWTGGWSWGPRLLLPVAVLAVVPLAPWLTADAARWRPVLVAATIGFVVSMPALIVPSSAQKDLPGLNPSGPLIDVQFELVPEVVSAGMDGRCAQLLEGYPLVDCLPAKWQIHVARSVGPVGDVVVGLVSLALAVVAAIAGSRCVRIIRAMPEVPSDPSSAPDDPDRALDTDPSSLA